MPLLGYTYSLIILGVIGFQVVLILGAPWGRLTQGGKHEGALPLVGRVAAGVSIFVLAGQALAILSAEGNWPAWPSWTGWAAVALSGVAMGLNWATPSAPERKLWGPVTTVMFALALAAMLGV